MDRATTFHALCNAAGVGRGGQRGWATGTGKLGQLFSVHSQLVVGMLAVHLASASGCDHSQAMLAVWRICLMRCSAECGNAVHIIPFAITCSVAHMPMMRGSTTVDGKLVHVPSQQMSQMPVPFLVRDRAYQGFAGIEPAPNSSSLLGWPLQLGMYHTGPKRDCTQCAQGKE